MKFVLSYGGGLNSSALLPYLIENKDKYPLDAVVFADTGDEHPHTYEAVIYFKDYAERHGIPFYITRNGKAISLYQYCWDKKIIPSRMKRDCTAKFKVRPIRRFLKKQFPKETFLLYIAFTYDEADRIKQSDVNYVTLSYPMVDQKIKRDDCKTILFERNMLIPKKSGCFFCPFTTRNKWVELLNTDRALFDRAMALEKNNKNYPKFLLNITPLEKIKDSIDGQHTLDEFEPSCDVMGSCFL